MRRLLILLLLVGPSVGCAQQVMRSDNAMWTLIPQYSDEFNGSSLDASKWGTTLWYNQSAAGCTWDVDCGLLDGGGVTVSGGNAQLRATYSGGRTYLAAFMSNYRFQYGYVEWRMKAMTRNANINSTVWLYTVEGGEEIDVLENLSPRSSPQTIYSTLHLWPPHVAEHIQVSTTTYQNTTGEGLDLDYHVYGLEWDPVSLRFYFDGVLYWTQDASQFHSPQHVIVSLETHSGTPDANHLPAAMYVDYIRVYQRSGSLMPGATAGH